MNSRKPQSGDIWQNPRTYHYWIVINVSFDKTRNTDVAECVNITYDNEVCEFPFMAIKKYWRYQA